MSLNTQKTLSLLAVIAVAVMIFCFSAQSGEDSSALSGVVTEAVLSVTVPGYRDMSPAQRAPYIERWGLMVRKLAHFSEFALLALTLVIHLHYARSWPSPWALMGVAWALATLYAGTDELHQMFVDNRGPALLDVCIDGAGALFGAALTTAVRTRIVRRNRRTAG